MSKIPQAGINLIKKFENCKLVAYPDPKTKGRPFTIGWGSTKKMDGSPFYLGERITQAQADRLFKHSLETEFFPAVQNLPFYSEMNDDMVSAMLSFVYNLGAYFYGAKGFATISANLKKKQWGLVAQSFLLYIDPGSAAEAGLLKRRKAEAELWSKGLKALIQTTPPNQSNSMKTRITALVATTLKKKVAQSYELKAKELRTVSRGRGYKVLSVEPSTNNHLKVELAYKAGTWYIYAPHWDIGETAGSTTSTDKSYKVLKVSYFSQKDSATQHALRMCFSSSCAMLADYLYPDAIDVAEQEDDYYMKKYVFKYGDTTKPPAQLKALEDVGVNATFTKLLNPEDVIEQINRNIPVPVGILHHGHVSSPKGGGHWLVIVGYDLKSKQWITHDPYGELDVVNGGYWGSTNGAFMRYSFANFNKRWMVEGPGHGWGIIATR